MSGLKPHQRLFTALDTTEVDGAVALAGQLKGAANGVKLGGVKLGKEFFTANGPQGVARVSAVGLPVFLDLKFYDIPNTVAAAVRAALPLKPFMLNVHASGGAAMMKAAAEAAAQAGPERPLMLAVTVLTSMDAGDLSQTGVEGPVIDHVRRLAALAKDCGLDGVVCSAREAETLRKDLGPHFKLATPGIRPAWAALSGGGGQKRVMTPSQALAAGADYLVVGRPITASDNPAEAAARIVAELGRFA